LTDLYSTHAALYDAAFDWDVAHEVAPIARLSGVARGRVLEPMCGSGRLLRGFARTGFATVGVDRSSELLAIARAKYLALGLTGDWLLADVTAFELGETCDLAVCPINSLAHLQDRGELIDHLACMAASLAPAASYWLQLDLKQPRQTGEAEDWEFEYEGETVVVEWASSAARDGHETHLTRFTFADGRVVEERTSMKLWTWQEWSQLIANSPFAIASAWRGTTFEPLEVGAGLEGERVFWQRLVRR
jgi:SAM-dependent methyltransferase